MSKGDI